MSGGKTTYIHYAPAVGETPLAGGTPSPAYDTSGGGPSPSCHINMSHNALYGIPTKQVGGDHYRRMRIQPIEFITANNLGFCAGNVVKYISRYKHKNGREDLLKARHYIDLLLESEYPDNESKD